MWDNQKETIKCFAGDFIDNQQSLRFVSKSLAYLRMWEKMLLFSFLM